MLYPLRPIAFILASTNHGTMIVNRNDYAVTASAMYGVGHQLLSSGAFDPAELENIVKILNHCRVRGGDGVVMLDCGANIGVHTIECARHMHGWGEVLAVEAQERLYYALCGNIAVNNCFNARALWSAVGAENGTIDVPHVNYHMPASFGSLEIRPSARNERIGQKVDYDKTKATPTRLFTIDSLGLPRLDFLKLDVEGMEMEALRGAIHTVRQYHPVMVIEHIKTDGQQLQKFLGDHGYRAFVMGLNLLAIHHSDTALLAQLAIPQPA